MYKEIDKNGKEVVRWNTKKKYTKEELEKQRDEFEEQAKKGNLIDLTDLMINHGM